MRVHILESYAYVPIRSQRDLEGDYADMSNSTQVPGTQKSNIRKVITAITALALMASLMAVTPAQAATGTVEEVELKAPDAAANDLFGDGIAIDGDTLVIASPNDDDKGAASGSVYIYVRTGTTWTQQAKLTASNGSTGDRFGFFLDLDGDTLVVGAFAESRLGLNTGAAYIFVREGSLWSEQAILTASDAAAGDWFGSSVGLSGDTAVIGAWADDDEGTESGSAYIFVRNGTTWTQQAKLNASDAAADDQFGDAVSIWGDTVVIGALRHQDAGIGSGAAYVFTRSGTTWTQQAKLNASDAAADDEFGDDVSIYKDTIAISATQNDSFKGSVYIFTRTGSAWSQQANLTASDRADDDGFGSKVSLSKDTLAIGAPENDDSGSNSGSAYVFTREGTSWSQIEKLTASDAAAGDGFGWDITTNGDTVVVAASEHDDGGANSGAAYVFINGEFDTSLVGYWMLESDGTIYEFGDSPSYTNVSLASGNTTVGFDRTDSGDGLWILDSIGVIHVKGTAQNFGNVESAAIASNDQVASISATPSGLGYWVFTDLGQVFNFGDAAHYDDLLTLNITPNGLIVASASTPSGLGYYMLGSDGGVFAFGDAAFHGSIPGVLPPGALACAIVGLVPTPSGAGYWMVACDGGVFAFGDAPFRGSIPGVLPEGTQLNSPVNGLVPYGNGYLMVAADGGVFTFSDRAFLGSIAGNPPDTPIIAITAFVN